MDRLRTTLIVEVILEANLKQVLKSESMAETRESKAELNSKDYKKT